MAQKSYGFYTEGNAAKKIEYETIKKAHAAGKKGRSDYVRGNAAPVRRYETAEPVRKRKENPLPAPLY